MNEETQVIKESTCLSLSGTSTITYQIGSTPDGSNHIRLTGNSGNGYFNGYWVSLPKILAVLQEQDGPFIWSALTPMFEGRSVNSSCFMMAVLLAEKIIQPSKQQPRRYEMADTKLILPKTSAKKSASKIDPPAAIDPPADSEAPPATIPAEST